MGKCDPSELDALFQKVNDRGWQLASMPKLLSFIEESEEKARSAIALIAYLHISTADLQRLSMLRTHLGILTAIYLIVYPRDVCQPFIGLLERCFSDCEAIIEEGRHMILDQAT
jgi:hypothetical protein